MPRLLFTRFLLLLTGFTLGCGEVEAGRGTPAASATGPRSPDPPAASPTVHGESAVAIRDATGSSEAGDPSGAANGAADAGGPASTGEAAGAVGPGDPDGAGVGATPAARSRSSDPREAGEANDDTGTMDSADPSNTPSTRRVRIEGRQLLVDGKPFQIQGVCWNPVARGGVHPGDLNFGGFVQSDAELMRVAGINAVRTYETITDRGVLDTLQGAGIGVLNMVYAWGGDDPSSVGAKVEALKDHPAILMWVLGNEWNYNGLYVGLSHQASLDALNQAATRIRAIDSEHPIATIYGEIPSQATVDAMPDIDVWGINAYRGLSFGNLFEQFAAVSAKPMFLAEYGADAYDASLTAVNLDAQADATRALTQEILDHSAARTAEGRCLGGTIFEWADEWWKDSGGSPDTQDVGGIAPGGGPHPDQTFNEEWWGVVDIDRNPRPAYRALESLYAAP